MHSFLLCIVALLFVSAVQVQVQGQQQACPSTYDWTGAAGGASWADVNNWQAGGAEPLAFPGQSCTSDVVRIDSATVISLTQSVQVLSLVISASGIAGQAHVALASGVQLNITGQVVLTSARLYERSSIGNGQASGLTGTIGTIHMEQNTSIYCNKLGNGGGISFTHINCTGSAAGQCLIDCPTAQSSAGRVTVFEPLTLRFAYSSAAFAGSFWTAAGAGAVLAIDYALSSTSTTFAGTGSIRFGENLVVGGAGANSFSIFTGGSITCADFRHYAAQFATNIGAVMNVTGRYTVMPYSGPLQNRQRRSCRGYCISASNGGVIHVRSSFPSAGIASGLEAASGGSVILEPGITLNGAAGGNVRGDNGIIRIAEDGVTIGTVNVSDIVLAGGARLFVKIGGLSNFDRYVASGPLTSGNGLGELRESFVGGFSPSTGDTFAGVISFTPASFGAPGFFSPMCYVDHRINIQTNSVDILWSICNQFPNSVCTANTGRCACNNDTCASLGVQCGGAVSNGCGGNTTACGPCGSGLTCSSQQCQPTNCTPTTSCSAENRNCGMLQIGPLPCLNVSCGTCGSPPNLCNTTIGQCYCNDPNPCGQDTCGTVVNRCSEVIQCGNCPNGQQCLDAGSGNRQCVTGGSTVGGSTTGSPVGGSSTGSTVGGSSTGSTVGVSTTGSTTGSTVGGSTATAGSNPVVQSGAFSVSPFAFMAVLCVLVSLLM